MIEFIKKSLPIKKKISYEKKLEEFKLNFFNSPYHSWVLEDKIIKRLFLIFMDSLNEDLLNLLNKQELILLKSYGILACTISPPKNSEIIIIFPDLMKLLHSASPIHGLAILAHEIGHIVLGHSNMEISPILAQIQADTIAYEMGFGDELFEQIKSFGSSYEYNLRIKNLEALKMIN